MDGAEGERHVEWGAAVMHRLFDRGTTGAVETTAEAEGPRLADLRYEGWEVASARPFRDVDDVDRWLLQREVPATRWRDLCLYHSRFRAKLDGQPYSALCPADKLAVALEPWWLYLPRVILSGEIHEYMRLSRSQALGRSGLLPSKYTGEPACTTAAQVAGLGPRRAWHRVMSNYCRAWAYAHADGKADRWTAGRAVAP